MTVKLPATLIFVCGLAVAASGSAGPSGICPLSEEQTQKSIEAFSKLVPTFREPRCTGCHGRVNPFIDGIGEEQGRPDVPTSRSEHGGGAMVRGHLVNGLMEGESDCSGCHNNMPASRILGKSRWTTAPDALAFIGKDARALCEQIRDAIARAENFVGHITDDNGFNNFAGAAFNGNRGLDREMFPESEVPTEKPAISHDDLIKLGKAWVATTGGEFQGDKSCGCEPAHYALRVNVLNEINIGIVQHTSTLAPVDIPITFADDGTFSGDGDLNYHGTGSTLACTEQTGSQLNVHISGKAKETADVHSMNVKFEKSSPSVTTMSAQCQYHRPIDTQTSNAQPVSLHLDFTGDVGETRDYHMPGVPGVSSTMHVEIVKLP